jgi:chemotaxis methyl-accepting protein methylase
MSTGDDDPSEIERILVRARELSSVDFSAYKRSTLGRRIRLRVAMAGASSLAAYRSLVETDAAEGALLINALLVKTTAMFRDPEVFQALRRALLPRLFARRRAEGAETLRAWVPACSTGEEAYSIAMCLAEASLAQPLAASLLASDVDRAALERVARAVYPAAAAADVPPELAGRWLAPGAGGQLTVHPSLRAMVKSSFHDVVGSEFLAPPEAVVASFDLVSCRNLLIYLEPSTQQRLLMRLIKTAAPHGLLLLGPAESAPIHLLTELVPAAHRLPIYWIDGSPAG